MTEIVTFYFTIQTLSPLTILGLYLTILAYFLTILRKNSQLRNSTVRYKVIIVKNKLTILRENNKL